MNSTNLKAFVSVVDSGSFSRTARTLSITQPAVTTQIRTLEEELGETLLDRQYRNIELTEAGALFLPYAREILDQIRCAQRALQELDGEINGSLSIAASTIPGSYVVPRLMGEFARRYPQVDLDLAISDSTRAIDTLIGGDAHLALVGALSKDVPVDYTEIVIDELVVIASPDHPLAARKELSSDDLIDQRWIMRPDMSGTRRAALHLLRDAGLLNAQLNIVLTLGSDEAIISAVEAGLGIAIMSRLVAEKAVRLGTVVELDLAGEALTRPLYLATPHRSPTRAASAFLEFIAERMHL